MGMFNEVQCEILLAGQTLTNGQSKDHNFPVDGSTFKITSYGRLHKSVRNWDEPNSMWKDTEYTGTFRFRGDQGEFIATFDKGQLLILE